MSKEKRKEKYTVTIKLELERDERWSFVIGGIGGSVALTLPINDKGSLQLEMFRHPAATESVTVEVTPEYATWEAEGLKGEREDLLKKLNDCKEERDRKVILDKLLSVEDALLPVWEKEAEGEDEEAFVKRFVALHEKK